METEYNGWKNRQTWNVALWLMNDEYLYRKAVEYVAERKARGGMARLYSGFIHTMGIERERTGDNIAWVSTRLDYPALNEMMLEL